MGTPQAISTLGDLRRAVKAGTVRHRSVHQELRENLIAKLRAGEPLFPGIIGYDDTVDPAGRERDPLAAQLHPARPARPGEDAAAARARHAARRGDPGHARLRDPRRPARADLPRLPRAHRDRGRRPPIAWLARDERYVEKLATPDVTIADMIGDVDPIKAARAGLAARDELTMHYGLLPRANRGIFAINELPDLASKIQVGLFNILQEGDVQIKGYPVRLPLDVLLVFSANPEDYTARGKIITPLKDRIGSEIRTHYPRPRQEAMAITAQEAWVDRATATRSRVEVPGVRPRDRRGDRVPGAAGSEGRQALGRQPAPADHGHRERRLERRAARARQRRGGRRAARERHLRRAAVDHRQDRARVRRRAEGRRDGGARADPRGGRRRCSTATPRTSTRAASIEWFERGGTLELSDTTPAADVLAHASAGRRAWSSWRTPRASRPMPRRRLLAVGRSTSCSKASAR